MKKIQVSLLITMVILFFIYVACDLYAWPLSKFAENVMTSLFAIILLLIDPKSLLGAKYVPPNTPTENMPEVQP